MSRKTSSQKNFAICNHMNPKLGSISPTPFWYPVEKEEEKEDRSNRVFSASWLHNKLVPSGYRKGQVKVLISNP